MKKALVFFASAFFISAVFSQVNYDIGKKLKLIKVVDAGSGDMIKPGKLSPSGTRFYCGLEGTWERLAYFDVNLKKGTVGKINRLTEEKNWGKVVKEAYQPTITEDAKTIVFVSMNGEGTWDGNDLYISESTEKGVYGVPRKLDGISSPDLADAYPCISPDGLTLYFIQDNIPMVSKRSSRSSTFLQAKPLIFNSAEEVKALSVWVDPSEMHLYYQDYEGHIYASSREEEGGAFEAPALITDELDALEFTAGISLDAEMKYIFLYSSEGYDEDEVNTILWYKLK